jgi:hypothetical protein
MVASVTTPTDASREIDSVGWSFQLVPGHARHVETHHGATSL